MDTGDLKVWVTRLATLPGKDGWKAAGTGTTMDIASRKGGDGDSPRHRAGGFYRSGCSVGLGVAYFAPQDHRAMIVACLWSHTIAPDGSELLSFAAITDDPPAEVAAAGHYRCIVPIKPENMEAWLNPDPRTFAALYAILDGRERPFYEHRLAA